MGLAVGLALLQFYLTWFTSSYTFEMLLTFGGIGGEFYLSSLLIGGFYLRLPDRWRWDFWRFIALGVAANTFWNSFWQWHLQQQPARIVEATAICCVTVLERASR